MVTEGSKSLCSSEKGIRNFAFYAVLLLFSHQVIFDSDPMDCSPQGSSVHKFSKQEYGVGCHFLLQMFFLIQGSNVHLLLGRQILYHCATWEP